MSQQILRIIIAVAFLFHPTAANYNVQPQYQVSIMLEFHPGNPVHLCNGAIIYERLIITTANCMHFKFGSKGKPNLLDTSVLSVLAGSTNAFTDVLRINVSSIDIAKDFNPDTLENDLALLTLSQSLPLGIRSDMKWIMLDDNIHINHSCLANFFSRNSKAAISNYYQTEELTLYNNEICRNATKYPKSRQDDICSIYILPQQFDCAAADTFLSFNNDRGTGLVCKSYLVGLLSSVITRPDPKNNCSDVVLAAMYTNIFPHLMWVYNTMAGIETEYISTPYDSSLNSLVINSSNNNEILTSTILPLTTANVTSSSNSTTWNPEMTNFTMTGSTTENSTAWSPTLANSTSTNTTMINSTAANTTTTNSTTWNPTITASTVVNSTATNFTAVRPPTVTNSTTVNSTVINPSTWSPRPSNSTLWNSTAVNTTQTPPPSYPVARPPPTKPTYTSSTDSYIKYPSPTVSNFFNNSATSGGLSVGTLLIALVSLRLITIYH